MKEEITVPVFGGLEFKKSSSTIKDTFVLTIEGDENDGDYKTEVTQFGYEELKDYLSLISKIGDIITCNGDMDRDDYKPTEKEDDQMYDICPYSEYGMHDLNIDSFVYYDTDGEEFDVSFGPEWQL